MSASAASATVRVSGPTWASVPSGAAGKAGTRARVGLMPKQPVKAAGMRIEPPPSVPRCRAPMPSTVAATAPAEEPPVVMRVSQGLRVMPVSGLSLVAFQPYSGMAVLPSMTAPVLAQAGGGGRVGLPGLGGVRREPKRAGMPATRMLSLTPIGTPSSRPLGAPACQRASEARAAASAPSASRWHQALTAPS